MASRRLAVRARDVATPIVTAVSRRRFPQLGSPACSAPSHPEKKAQPAGAKTMTPPTRGERAEVKSAIQIYTANAATRGLVISWANLTEVEARRLVELTRTGDRSTRDWWPLVLRAAGIKH